MMMMTLWYKITVLLLGTSSHLCFSQQGVVALFRQT